MPVPYDIPPAAEFGGVAVREVRRGTRQGTLRPLICICDDGATYVVKPFSSAGGWPHCLEWICARLGRALDLNVPNYRQVSIDSELANGWNETGGRFIEPGTGFGSQFVSGADECDAISIGSIEADEAMRILSFDWWIRNSDRRSHNPNLLWSYAKERAFLIDHEKAGHAEGADAFWQDHLFAKQTPWITNQVVGQMRSALRLLPTIRKELPSKWTSGTDGLDWFFDHLHDSIANEPQQHWRPHE
jgi:hypothetical protein